MESHHLPVGSYVRLAKQDLQAVVDQLKVLGYRTVGPQVADGAIVYDDLDEVRDLPVGIVDVQDGGRYRLQPDEEAGYFDFVVGPHTLKQFLFPPRETVLQVVREEGRLRLEPPPANVKSVAVIGPRACDLCALAVQDRVFLEGEFVDEAYRARREALFVVAVNCQRAAATCFCHSLKTGPALASGHDLGLTELDDYYVVEVASDQGGVVITAARWAPCSLDDIHKSRDMPADLAARMRERATAETTTDDAPRGRHLDTTDLSDLLMDNLEHPRWEETASRCLACANCTLVCPTCFCSTVEEVSDLSGDHVRRERTWASCFTSDHSYMNTGTVRRTTLARYRQWLTHKLATWHDQFGTYGCVGCGRCITWCPVGIDLTEEVAAIRGDAT